MQVTIIAGGFGTRMKPYIGNHPKSLIPIEDNPFISLQLFWTRKADHIHFCLGYKSKEITSVVQDLCSHKEFSVNIEGSPLGVVGSIKESSNFLQEQFAVLLGDVIPRVEFEKLIGYAQKYIQSGKSIMFLAPSKNIPGQYGNTKMEDEKITAYSKEASFKGDFVDIGFWILQREHVERFGDVLHEEKFFNALIQRDSLMGINVGIGSWEVGSIEGLLKIQEDFSSNLA
ncbi:hypothetical protein FOA24_05845 [Bacillus thuringiensis]|uniref:nucleotidyltransferase family protein n=1 Tax=Bacillus thuringiensis TaxID=1428 RepID=UPI003336FC58